jgi:ACS family hexuronate transporter-like MFS transporter
MKLPGMRSPWAVCGVLLLATLLNYMDRQTLAVTLPTLKQEYNLAEGRIGMVEGCFGFAFAAGSVLFGWVADRVGPRRLYPIVLAGWSLAGIATAGAGQPWIVEWFEATGEPPGTGVFRWLLLCRTALGLFEAGHWPCALLTVRAILTARDRTLGNGILQSGASIGAILVAPYVELTDRLGLSWGFPFWSIGLAGLAWVPLWLWAVGHHDLSRPKDDESSHSVTSAGNHLTRRLIILAIVVATLTISWQFLRAWIALFLQDHHGYTPLATRSLMPGYFIAADVGCILSGALVTRLTRRGWQVQPARLLGYVIFAVLAAAAAFIPFAGNGWLMVALLYIAGAGILGLHPYYYALTQELSVTRMGILSGTLAAWGWIVSSMNQILIGPHIQATKSYELGMMIVGLAPMVGLIALLLCWPRIKTSPAEMSRQ